MGAIVGKRAEPQAAPEPVRQAPFSNTPGCWSFLISLAMASSACDSAERRAYKALAHELNPILADMQRTAAAVLEPAEDEHHAIVVACSRADDTIRALASTMTGGADSAIERHGNATLQSEAKTFLEWRGRSCSGHSAVSKELCSQFCRGWWRGLATHIEQLRTAAHALDVTLEPLYP